MSSQRETLLQVAGMTCTSCVRHVDHALRELEGVEDVEVRLAEGQVRVKHQPDRAPIERMVEALHEAGYAGTPST